MQAKVPFTLNRDMRQDTRSGTVIALVAAFWAAINFFVF
jgi:hypothetical protein